MSMLDWSTYRRQLTVRIGEIAKLSPDTIKGYQALSAAGQNTNLLGPKIRELISLAVAVSVRCDGCITVHTEAAVRHGASRAEIAEALGVATAVNAGAALVYSTRVLDAYEQLTAAGDRARHRQQPRDLTAWMFRRHLPVAPAGEPNQDVGINAPLVEDADP